MNSNDELTSFSIYLGIFVFIGMCIIVGWNTTERNLCVPGEKLTLLGTPNVFMCINQDGDMRRAL